MQHSQLPNSPESEQALLGAILLSPYKTIMECERAAITTEWFWDFKNQVVWDHILTLKPADVSPTSVMVALRSSDSMKKIGSPVYISELAQACPVSAMATQYIRILESCFTLRRAIGHHEAMLEKARTCSPQDTDKYIDEMETGALAVAIKKQAAEIVEVMPIIRRVEERIERLIVHGNPIDGIVTGYSDIDDVLKGLRGGQMILIAGRPSHGKTAFALNIADHISIEKRVGIISMEMPLDDLVMRMVFTKGRTSDIDLMHDTGNFSIKCTTACAQLSRQGLFFEDAGSYNITTLRAICRRMVTHKSVDVIIIDYIGLVQGVSKRASDSGEQEMSEVSKGIKRLALELNIPIIALAQINREFEKRGGKSRPRLSDLRGSGSLEQDSDIVIMIHRPDLMTDDDDVKAELKNKVEIIIAKNRNGARDQIVNMHFIPEQTRFELARKTFSEEPEEQTKSHWND